MELNNHLTKDEDYVTLQSNDDKSFKSLRTIFNLFCLIIRFFVISILWKYNRKMEQKVSLLKRLTLMQKMKESFKQPYIGFAIVCRIIQFEMSI